MLMSLTGQTEAAEHVGFLQPTLHRLMPSLLQRVKSDPNQMVCMSEATNPCCPSLFPPRASHNLPRSPQQTSSSLAMSIRLSFLHFLPSPAWILFSCLKGGLERRPQIGSPAVPLSTPQAKFSQPWMNPILYPFLPSAQAAGWSWELSAGTANTLQPSASGRCPLCLLVPLPLLATVSPPPPFKSSPLSPATESTPLLSLTTHDICFIDDIDGIHFLKRTKLYTSPYLHHPSVSLISEDEVCLLLGQASPPPILQTHLSFLHSFINQHLLSPHSLDSSPPASWLRAYQTLMCTQISWGSR